MHASTCRFHETCIKDPSHTSKHVATRAPIFRLGVTMLVAMYRLKCPIPSYIHATLRAFRLNSILNSHWKSIFSPCDILSNLHSMIRRSSFTFDFTARASFIKRHRLKQICSALCKSSQRNSGHRDAHWTNKQTGEWIYSRLNERAKIASVWSRRRRLESTALDVGRGQSNRYSVLATDVETPPIVWSSFEPASSWQLNIACDLTTGWSCFRGWLIASRRPTRVVERIVKMIFDEDCSIKVKFLRWKFRGKF